MQEADFQPVFPVDDVDDADAGENAIDTGRERKGPPKTFRELVNDMTKEKNITEEQIDGIVAEAVRINEEVASRILDDDVGPWGYDEVNDIWIPDPAHMEKKLVEEKKTDVMDKPMAQVEFIMKVSEWVLHSSSHGSRIEIRSSFPRTCENDVLNLKYVRDLKCLFFPHPSQPFDYLELCLHRHHVEEFGDFG